MQPQQSYSEQENTYEPPKEMIHHELVSIWEDVLNHNHIGVRDNFFEIGGHSLLAVYMFDRIKKKYGKELPLATLFQAPTIEELSNILRDKQEPEQLSSLVPIQPAGSKPPFFCVHAHGGNVLGYYDLAKYLGKNQPFYGLQAQNFEEENKVLCFEEMAAQYIQEIRTVQPHGPYYLGGWCLGGDIALEMAQQLQGQGEDVALVVMIQSVYPEYQKRSRKISLFNKLSNRLIERMDLEWDNFLEVDSSKKLAYSWRRAKAPLMETLVNMESLCHRFVKKTNLEFPRSRALLIKSLTEKHHKAYANYHPQSYKGHVTLFRASKQAKAVSTDPALGWGNTLENLEIIEIPGHRLGMLTEPRVKLLAEKLKNSLAKAIELCVVFNV